MKKFISIFLVLAIMITFMAPVMANSTTSTDEAATDIAPVKAAGSTSVDKSLEKAIKYVKAKFDIPETYKQFNYNVYNNNGINVWYLSWSKEDEQKYISVAVNENDFISSYSYYQKIWSDNKKKIPNYSKEQAQKLAEKFVNDLDPKLLVKYKYVDNNYYYSDRDYYFNYIRQVNGIDYKSNNLSITVNKLTGEISNYSCSLSENTTFEDASKIIDLDQAKKAFMEKLGLKLVYNIKNENDKNTSYLSYVLKDANKYIDAITGEVESNSSGNIVYTDQAMSREKEMLKIAAGEVSDIVLTPEEMDAVKNIAGLLSKEDVDKYIRDISLFNVDKEFKLTRAELRKDWINKDALVWSLYYSKVINAETKESRDLHVSVNARTGDIKEFWTYNPSPEGSKPLKTKDQAKAIVEAALKSLIPSYYEKVKYDDTTYTYDDKTQSNFSFSYIRMENGLQVPSDYISVSYDNLSGNISSIYSNWTEGVKFESPKNAINLEKAYEVLFEKIGMDIQYVNDYSDNTADKMIMPEQINAAKAVLGYFINNDKPIIISGKTGELLNYNGMVYKENIISDYTDINGLAQKDQIKILTELAIRYNEDELKANDDLLQKDYFLILCKLNDIYVYTENLDADKAVDRMYTELINQGIITKEEKLPQAKITREDAAKYFIKFLRLSYVAEIKGIYKTNFKDEDKINPDLIGYVSLVSGLKVMNGANGNFMPKKNITRLEGLLTIYNYLKAK